MSNATVPLQATKKEPKEYPLKYLILGGGGFIGSSISDRLLKDGNSVRIFERAETKQYRIFEPTEDVDWVVGDFQDSYMLEDAVKGVDAVIHLISTTVPKTSFENPIYDIQTNVVATVNLLEIMVRQNVEKIVFISSGGTVYGTPQYLPIDENHPTDPMVPYGISKLAIEKYLQLYQSLHGIRSVILRASNPYGMRQNIKKSQGAIGVFLDYALNNAPITIWGDGKVVRDYLHVEDVSEAFICALNYTGSKSVFNISSGVGASLNEILQMIEKKLQTPIFVTYTEGRTFDIPTNVLSNELALKELGWTARISLEDGISQTIKWKKQLT